MNEDRAVQLRREFDESFQREPEVLGEVAQEILLIGVGDKTYGVRLTEITGVVKTRKLTGLPRASHGLLGLTGFRGALLGVYHLGAWLDRPSSGTDWMMIVQGPEETKMGLAFESLRGQLAVSADAFHQSEPSGVVGSLIHRDGGVLPVLSLPKLLERFGKEATGEP